VSGWERIVGTAPTADSTGPKTVTADCTAGRKAVGGGYEITGGNITTGDKAKLVFTDSRPLDADTWTVTADEAASNSSTWSIRAYVLCVTTP
jgi:hypothetical protein